MPSCQYCKQKYAWLYHFYCSKFEQLLKRYHVCVPFIWMYNVLSATVTTQVSVAIPHGLLVKHISHSLLLIFSSCHMRQISLPVSLISLFCLTYFQSMYRHLTNQISQAQGDVAYIRLGIRSGKSKEVHGSMLSELPAERRSTPSHP